MSLGDRALAGLRAFVSEPEPRTPGEILGGRFELRQRIGDGGMGVVYAGLDRASGEEVAIKLLRGGGDHDEARFDREVGALAAVSHPGVVSTVAHGVHEGVRYLVMPRLEGCTLAERLRLGRLTITETVQLGLRVAQALAEVHRAGVTHRDIKPSNIFLRGPSGHGLASDACLLDFGVARPDLATTLTARGAMVGTPGYMAPEQVRAPSDATPSSDIFSFGCVLYECLVGHAPFAAETTYDLLARVLLEIPSLVRERRPDAPLGLEALVEQMLAKTPDGRPTAAEIARVLDEILIARAHQDKDTNEETAGAPAPGHLADGALVEGKYRVEGVLGEGGMGVVFAARHIDLGTRVAIKLLRSGAAEEGRFLREAQAMSRLESEHVARVLDVGRTDDGRPFMVMEHLRGVDLARHLATKGPPPAHLAVEYVSQALDAVAEAHELGIVHRDLKPSNLFLAPRRDGRALVKVLDFGISKVTSSLEGRSVALTETADSAVMGSIAYMSPEQLESSARADVRSDVWSIGVVLFELLTGRRPFEGESAVAVAARIARAEPPSCGALRRDLPPGLAAVVRRCLEKDPSARFQTATELLRALDPFRAATAPTTLADEPRDQAEGDVGQRAAANTPALDQPRRRGKKLWTGLGLGLGALVITVAVLRSSPLEPRDGGATQAVTTPPPAAPTPAPNATASTTTALLPSATMSPEVSTPAPSSTLELAPVRTLSAAKASSSAPSSSARAAAPAPTTQRSAPTAQRPAATAQRPAPAVDPRSLDLRDPALEGR